MLERCSSSRLEVMDVLSFGTEMVSIFFELLLGVASEFLDPGRHVQSISTEIDKLHKGMRNRLEITISGFIEIQTGTE